MFDPPEGWDYIWCPDCIKKKLGEDMSFKKVRLFDIPEYQTPFK